MADTSTSSQTPKSVPTKPGPWRISDIVDGRKLRVQLTAAALDNGSDPVADLRMGAAAGRHGRGARLLDATKAYITELIKHRSPTAVMQNFEALKTAPCEVPTGAWVPLTVKLVGSTVEVSVNGKSVLKHDDGRAALPAGRRAGSGPGSPRLPVHRAG